MPRRHLVTSALPYANGPLHLGHLAGAYLPADVYVRYLRSKGEDVVWVCGSDEHGAAISMRAKKEGRSEQEIVDTYHELFRKSFAEFGISFDIYHRTSSALHHATSQELFLQLIARGDQFEVRTTEQYYDEGEGAFLADRFITGTCPNCAYLEAFGDQCENCGKDLSPRELIHPRSTISGNVPTLRETKHWYFRLDEHEEWLRAYIADGIVDGVQQHDPRTWRNHVLGQCLSWLDAGLQPRAYTRDLDWGIPVPLPGAEGKVLYVWFDAPIGYISATKQWAIDRGEPEAWERYWKDPESTLVHFIGKDNIVFHCLTFQATLRALGDYNVATNVPANQFLNFEGDKFSKSRGWGISMDEYLETFASFPNHVDAMRYALIRNMPEGKDADFRWEEFVNFHDKELADKLGNFINRTLVLAHKYASGKVPNIKLSNELGHGLMSIVKAPSKADELKWEKYGVPPRALTIDYDFTFFFDKVTEEIEKFQFKSALSYCISFVDVANEELQSRAPWELFKVDKFDPDIQEAVFVACQEAAMCAVLLSPFVPAISNNIFSMLNVSPISFKDAARMIRNGDILLEGGHVVGAPEILVSKVHDRRDDSRLRLIQAQIAKLDAIRAESGTGDGPTFAPVKETIAYEDFAKLDLRTGTIVRAEPVPKADKLLRLEVDLGFARRTIVSGIAQHFDPAALAGKRCLVLVNLAPRKLRGVESAGMILLAEGPDGVLQFVAPDGEFPAGMPVT